MELHRQRVEALRAIMSERGWDAVVITGSDPHNSEYPAPRWKQVEWISGFTGEAGDVVVTMDEAGLWTDSRYFIQSVKELDGSGIDLHKTRQPDSVGIPHWLSRKDGVRTVALDGTAVSADMAQDILSCGLEIVDVPDLLSRLWTDRPEIPQTPITTLDAEGVGESRLQKIVWLRKFLMREDCSAILLSSLDEIAWLLNVRGQDIEYNPFVISYLLVSLDEVLWFVKKEEEDPTDPDTADSFVELRADGVEICNYSDLLPRLAECSENICIDSFTLNYNVYSFIYGHFGDGNIIDVPSPVVLRKAVKNEVEIEGMREAFHMDGLAVERFLWWLETELAAGRTVTEWEASCKLTSLRSEIPGYRGNSFGNISAYGPNAALPHYSTPEQGSAVILPRGLYLTDSGGQYLFGTTDITRTVPLGDCTHLEKEDYTLVLKGMIALSMAVFPEGTPGCRLDVLAREPMWRFRRNFGHGTGHGLGFYLGVHEGPQDIRQNLNSQPLLPGMITSNEPGLYREGMHGVRHENIVLCVEAGSSEFASWNRFETLTLCHIDTGAVLPELLTDDERRWLNDYNARVCRTLTPDLSPEVAAWLAEKTRPL